MTGATIPARIRDHRSIVWIALALALALAVTAATASAAPTPGAASIEPAEGACRVEIAPKSAVLAVGAAHTVTATLTAPCFVGAAAASAGAGVGFVITSGPNAGVSGIAAIDATGSASFTYVGAAAGTDSIAASVELANVTLGDTASATWTASVAALQADPTVSIATSRRCVSRRLAVRPRYTGGALESSTLFIDGRRVKTKTGAGTFVINTARYGAGRHHIEIVSIFASGKSASRFGSFTRCRARSAAKRVSPRFTG